MPKIGLWQIADATPKKIQESSVNLEKHLEDWIEVDPDLLQNGLTIVGRQIKVEGGIIDLLALDPRGQLAVIEIKKGMLDRDTIAQVIDYASCLTTIPAEELEQKLDAYLKSKNKSLNALLDACNAPDALDPENREIHLFVVGVGKAQGLERMVDFLSEKFNVPISVVSYDVFKTSDECQILAREITEPKIIKESQPVAVEDVCKLADKNGMGKQFRQFLAFSEEKGLYPRPYKHCIMYTPQSNKTRMLYTVWADWQSKMYFYISPKAIAEFFPISEENAAELVGKEGYIELDGTQAEEMIEKLEKLFDRINGQSEE